jgi:hypothetical protein
MISQMAHRQQPPRDARGILWIQCAHRANERKVDAMIGYVPVRLSAFTLRIVANPSQRPTVRANLPS